MAMLGNPPDRCLAAVMRVAAAALLVIGCSLAPVVAQQSASYSVESQTLNFGGHPHKGVAGSSPAYRMSSDALGDSVAGVAMSSLSFRLDSGMVSAYAPAGEVTGLRFDAQGGMQWDAVLHAVSYQVYRGPLTDLPGGYGSCVAAGITEPAWNDPNAPAAGTGDFYLVTASNRLDEEGSSGVTSAGQSRAPGTPCP